MGGGPAFDVTLWAALRTKYPIVIPPGATRCIAQRRNPGSSKKNYTIAVDLAQSEPLSPAAWDGIEAPSAANVKLNCKSFVNSQSLCIMLCLAAVLQKLSKQYL